MDWGSRILCGWPGLPGLWHRGHFSSLLLAVGFAIVLNLALISSFIWPHSLGEMFPIVAWPTVLILWTVAVYVSVSTLPDVMSVAGTANVSADETSDTLFIQAQREYLGGDWQAAESLLRQRLSRSPRDIESRLLLATLLRHVRRLDDASDQLDTMRKFDESHAWDFEILRERKLIQLILEHETAQSSSAENETELLPDNNDGYVHIDVTGDR
jgi:hypothetical protein